MDYAGYTYKFHVRRPPVHIKRLILLAACFMLAGTPFAIAGGDSDSLNLRYPIVLAHGWAGSDEYILGIDYFWGIKAELEDEGADVLVADMSAFDTSDVRGAQLKTQILRYMAATGAAKVNIIGHSQGGVTSRYMISNLGMKSRVASLTMVSSPNRGTAVADVVTGKLPNVLKWSLAALANTFWGGLVAGDSNSRFLAATYELTHYNMENVFNPNTPDMAGVRYLSYAGKMYAVSANVLLTPTWALIKYFDGDNDGVVPMSSAKWGTYKGDLKGLFGVDHFMEVNHLFGNTPGFDAKGFYVDMARSLEKYGL